jgi:hypothetical protein
MRVEDTRPSGWVGTDERRFSQHTKRAALRQQYGNGFQYIAVLYMLIDSTAVSYGIVIISIELP